MRGVVSHDVEARADRMVQSLRAVSMLCSYHIEMAGIDPRELGPLLELLADEAAAVLPTNSNNERLERLQSADND